METLLQIGLTNALVATVLAVLAATAGKFCRRPALAHALWLLVIVKLLTPPLVIIPIEWPKTADEPAAVIVAEAPAIPPVELPFMPPRAAEAIIPQPEPDDPPIVIDPFEPALPVPLPVQLPREMPPIREAEPLVLPDPVAFPANDDPEWTFPEIPWWTLFGGIWLGGSVVWFALALFRIHRFQTALALSREAPASLQREASELALAMGLRDCPIVLLVPGVVSPLLWAVSGYPKLLLPASLLDRLDALQRRTLLAHELAHYRRHDHYVRCLEFIALGIYWWFPLAWWATRELREAEEECCDAWVIWTLPDASKAYASALVETLDFLSGSRPVLPPVASGLGQLKHLRRRLAMIMRGTKPRQLGGFGLLTVVGLAAVLLPLVPTLAQQDTPIKGEQREEKPQGNGVVLRSEQPKDQEKAKEPKRYEMEFKSTPWGQVLQWLGDISGIALVIQHPPPGSLTFKSPMVEGRPKTYTVGEIIDILNEALLPQKYTIIQRQASLMLWPTDEPLPIEIVRTATIEDLEHGDFPKSNYIRVTFQLTKLKASEFAPGIKKMLGPYGQVIPIEASNQIIMLDTVGNLRVVVKTIRDAEKAAAQQKKAAGGIGGSSGIGGVGPPYVPYGGIGGFPDGSGGAGSKGGGGTGGFGSSGFIPAGGPMEQRLADLERKLDSLLQEIRDIRKSMGKSPSPPAPGKGQDPFGPPRIPEKGIPVPPPARYLKQADFVKDLGAIKLGEEKTIDIPMVGDRPFHILAVRVNGGGVKALYIRKAAETHSLTVQCQPTSLGDFERTMYIETDLENATIAVTVKGTVVP